ncbi:MAG: EamA family transporter [Firmicutes bacterium]|nr:EamA family transporter [Bacillota bacterium]
MIRFFLPVLVIVVSNVFYDISAKLFPSDLNAQFGLMVVYTVGVVTSAVMFFITTKGKVSLRAELRKGNWLFIAYALCSMGIDFGYILLFRADWNVSIGSLVCNILLAVSLLLIGVLFYKEKLGKTHFAGMFLCIAGLIGINCQNEFSFGYFLPVIIVVVANVLYDVVAKSVPEDINTFVGLMITHFTLIIINGAIYFVGHGFSDVANQFSMVNWAVIAFAITMVGLDAGYILLYRAGWNISLGTLVCNISLAIAMLIIGGTAFNELVTWLQIVSVVVCAVGLVLISYMEIRIKTGEEEKIPDQA